MLICPKWGSTDILWRNSNWTWSECRLVDELSTIFQGGIDASKIYEETLWQEEKDREKKKRLIRLICKVNGENYNEEKEVKDIKIKIKDIKLVLKAVMDIELKVKE